MSFPPRLQCAGRDLLPGEQKYQGVSQHQSLSPKYRCSKARDLPLQPVLLEDPQCQGGREGQTPCSAPATIYQSGGSCSRLDCRDRRSTLPGQAAEVKGRELTPSAHSHAGGFSQHPSAQPHRPGTGDSGGVPGIEVTHLQGDTSTFPLLRPLYSQPCEGCSHHQGS